MADDENDYQDVGAAKRRKRRAIDDCQKEQSQSTQMPKCRESPIGSSPSGLKQRHQHHFSLPDKRGHRIDDLRPQTPGVIETCRQDFEVLR